MARLPQDIRHAFHMLRNQPAFTAVAILILALGIGANTAIFSVVDASILRPLPYSAPDRLVMVKEWDSQGYSRPYSGLRARCGSVPT
jgi:hypothetical protein